jgi:DNA-binding transcriptional MocR family regulator
MPVNPFDGRPLSWRPPLAAAHGKAVYLALAAALENDIRSGALPPGTKLPPQRELADFLDIDFTTVTRAYGVCREKGLIYGVTGRGTFVAARNDGCAGAVDCAVVQGFPETGAEEIASAAREILSRSSAADLFSYRNRDGGTLAIKAGVQWLKSAGVDAAPERIAVFPGAQGAISAALISLFSPGDALATDEFTYANLIALAKLAKIRLVATAADKDGMSPAALDEMSRKHGIRGVFLMPHCANPTGNTLGERRRNALAAIARERDLIIIEDDASLLPPADSGRTMFCRLPEQTVYISGSTRYIAPGLRATFMAFPEKFAPRLLDALHHLTIKAGALDTGKRLHRADGSERGGKIHTKRADISAL